jgi:hypothetical protein
VIRQEPRVVLAIPEVLEMELEKHKSLAAQNLSQKLLTAMRELETTTGAIQTLSSISPPEIRGAISNRIAELDNSIIRPEVTLRQVRSSLRRINDESPPNGPKNQQAKDSLLWEACIDLTAEYEVLLVTADGGFYRDRRPDKGLAENLAAEDAVQVGRLRLFASVGDLLEFILPDYATKYPAPQLAEIRTVLERELRQFLELRPTAVDARLAFHEADVHLRAYPGEQSDVLSVSFSVRFRVTQEWSAEDGSVTAIGECKFNSTPTQILDLQFQTIQWLLHAENGQELRATEVFAIDAAAMARGEAPWAAGSARTTYE